MSLALFGGTFDPIHRGHLAIASAAADAFALDRVIFAPTGRQPLKSDTPTASFADRLAMTALACTSTSDSRFLPSDLDAPRPDGAPNYTIDLLRHLSASTPREDIFVLAGADSFLTIPRWREPEALLRDFQWIVVSRPGSSLSDDQLAPLALTPAQRRQIHLLATVHEDVSATELRRRLAAGEPCTTLIPPAVADYIRTHGLYRQTTAPTR